MLAASFGLVFGVQRLVPTYDRAWYKALRKPAWNPPNYVFPLVWIPLKILLSVALYLVMSGAPTRGALLAPLALFGAHLALGNMWNVSERRPVALSVVCCLLNCCLKNPSSISRFRCCWSPQVVFFGRHRMQQSLGWMGAFWASIAASIAAFYQVGRGVWKDLEDATRAGLHPGSKPSPPAPCPRLHHRSAPWPPACLRPRYYGSLSPPNSTSIWCG